MLCIMDGIACIKKFHHLTIYMFSFSSFSSTSPGEVFFDVDHEDPDYERNSRIELVTVFIFENTEFHSDLRSWSTHSIRRSFSIRVAAAGTSSKLPIACDDCRPAIHRRAGARPQAPRPAAQVAPHQLGETRSRAEGLASQLATPTALTIVVVVSAAHVGARMPCSSSWTWSSPARCLAGGWGSPVLCRTILSSL